jgi:aldose 1-epimerase
LNNNKKLWAMTANIEDIGELEGQKLLRVTLENEHAQISFLTLGCITQSWIIPTENGPLDVVLGFDDPIDYLQNRDYFGTTIGRVANRISGAKFSLNGSEYHLDKNGPGMTLHGGSKGLSTRMWQLDEASKERAQFSYHSPHLEGGFPGNVDVKLTLTLDGSALRYSIDAAVDRPTPLNFAQHNYYNLLGEGPIWTHEMQIDASRYTPLGDDLLPTGEVASIEGTRFDFCQRRQFGAADPSHEGIDMAYVLDEERDLELPVAQVNAPNRVELSLKTNQPCLQTYNGNNQSVETSGARGRKFGRCSAICIEPQKHSNAVNTPAFPSIIVTPDAPYHYWAEIDIAQK